jgi:hypothetical protein
MLEGKKLKGTALCRALSPPKGFIVSSIPSNAKNGKPSSEARRFGGFQEPNFTPVPDEFFDLFLPDLLGSELKVFLYIVRRTLGFKKRMDAVSLTQICEGITRADGEVLDRGTGLTRRGAVYAVEGLVDKCLLRKITQRAEDGGFLPSLYSLRFASAEEHGREASPPPEQKATPKTKPSTKAPTKQARPAKASQSAAAKPESKAEKGGGSQAELTRGGREQVFPRVGNKRSLGGREQAFPNNKQIFTRDSVTRSSSSPTPPPPAADRLRPVREEEDFPELTDAINRYTLAGTKFTGKLLTAARQVDPAIVPREVAMLVHASVPRGYAVQGPGYFLHAVPPLVDSPARKLRPEASVGDDVEAQAAFVQAEAERILADPNASPDDLAFARKLLGPEA